MRHAGEACLSLETAATEAQRITGPPLFYPLTGEGESRWYAFLEEGETYRYEAWMRRDGASNIPVTLTFSNQYESIEQSFSGIRQLGVAQLYLHRPATADNGFPWAADD